MGKPLWRRAFDEVDRRVAGPVERGAHSDLFGDLVALQWKLARRAQREVERRTRRALDVAFDPPLEGGVGERGASGRCGSSRARPSKAPADLLSRVERDVQRA